MKLKQKKIILGVTGSIAAYKSCILVRELIKAGNEVQCILTPEASEFVGSITWSTLSKRPAISNLTKEGVWTDHVALGLWADALVIAPATANTLAKAAQGICDNILLATYLSAKCPTFWAPAMDLDMWAHPATQNNIDTLKRYGNHLIPVGNGELASGLVGDGRMAEVEDILSFLEKSL